MNSLDLPKVIFGTSSLGNLYVAQKEETKLNIVKECLHHSAGKVVFDSAGKYGAGLSLEVLGRSLKKLEAQRDKIIISNKLGWYRTPLKTLHPTFEPGIWKDLENDAVQHISYDGIISCFEQGNELLNGYLPQMVSVHDPDEYLNTAASANHYEELYNNVLDAYKALLDLKKAGKVQSIGIGAKDWQVIKKISADIDFDWMMIANCMTIMNHPPELLSFISGSFKKNITVINSAVFHSGFLVGSNYYDYVPADVNDPSKKYLFEWRERFFNICNDFEIKPAAACVQFAMMVPGVKSIALNTTDPERVEKNIHMAETVLPAAFWQKLQQEKLISADINNWITTP